MSKLQMVFAMMAALAVIATMAALGVVLALAMAREDGAGSAEQHAAAGDLEPRVPGWTLFRRALGQRCPRCGRGAVFAAYFRMNSRCGECGAVFWVDQGEWLGAFVIDWACATGAAIVV
jgi:ribosomal protein S27AE